MLTVTTADGYPVRESDLVFNYYDGYWGTVGYIDSHGWFNLFHIDGSRGSYVNGERVCKVIPRGNPFYGTPAQ